MAAGSAVWGIDIGQCSLKALKLRLTGTDQVEALAFDLIEYPQLLSQPDADPDALIHTALEKFASRNEFQGDRFVIGVPGQQTFARFCKMPPVDPKKLPELVRFEASQQIPFDIDDVVWDYQTFTAADSPDVEVGIFAMRNDLIRRHIGYFTAVGITADIVQTLPSALYNFSCFEHPDPAAGQAGVIINVGAQNTDLVVVEPHSAWTRNIPLGGNNFTEALVRAFKLPFSKAESLKRTAATSKYARQIFQAMRPVFAELVAEIQRSIGFYSSTRREVELKHVWALGNAFRLPGLQKYLENNLSIAGGIFKVEKFDKLATSAALDTPQFSNNTLTFAAAYGLALQGLGLARINASLLPSELVRASLWSKKRPYFVAAASILGLAAILPYTRNMLDQQSLASAMDTAERVAQPIIAEAKGFREQFNQVQTNTTEQEKNLEKLLELRKDKQLIARIASLIHEAMPAVHADVANVATADELKQLAEMGQLPPRTQRRQLLIDSVSIDYVPDIDGFELSGASASGGPSITPGMRGRGRGGMRNPFEGMGGRGRGGREDGLSMPGGSEESSGTGGGFNVTVTGRLLYGKGQGEAVGFLTDEYYRNLREKSAEPGLGFYIPDDDPKDNTKHNITRPVPRRLSAAVQTLGVSTEKRGPGTSQEPGTAAIDPITGEDMSNDWTIEFAFKVKIGEKPPSTQDKVPEP